MKRTLMNQPARGFTLVEVMITVVIVGILTAVALPSYRQSVMKSQRSVAKGVVIEQAQLLERFFTQQGTYTAGPSAARVSPTGATGGAIRYNVTTSIPAGGTTYTVTATPAGAQAGDKCGNLIMDQTGRQTVSVSPAPTDCW